MKFRKLRGNNIDFSTIKITSKKVSEHNLDFRPEKLHRKKYVETIGILDHQNYTERSKWKRPEFFDQRYYIEKVRGNDMEVRQNLVFNVST